MRDPATLEPMSSSSLGRRGWGVILVAALAAAAVLLLRRDDMPRIVLLLSFLVDGFVGGFAFIKLLHALQVHR